MTPPTPSPTTHYHTHILCSVGRFGRYISSHSASIQKTKLFLDRENSRVLERQAALRKLQSGSSVVPDQEGAPAEEVLRSLQQVRDPGRCQKATCESVAESKSHQTNRFFFLCVCDRKLRRSREETPSCRGRGSSCRRSSTLWPRSSEKM